MKPPCARRNAARMGDRSARVVRATPPPISLSTRPANARRSGDSMTAACTCYRAEFGGVGHAPGCPQYQYGGIREAVYQAANIKRAADQAAAMTRAINRRNERQAMSETRLKVLRASNEIAGILADLERETGRTVAALAVDQIEVRTVSMNDATLMRRVRIVMDEAAPPEWAQEFDGAKPC